MKGLGGAARNGILSLTIRDKAVLYAICEKWWFIYPDKQKL